MWRAKLDPVFKNGKSLSEQRTLWKCSSLYTYQCRTTHFFLFRPRFRISSSTSNFQCPFSSFLNPSLSSQKLKRYDSNPLSPLRITAPPFSPSLSVSKTKFRKAWYISEKVQGLTRYCIFVILNPLIKRIHLFSPDLCSNTFPIILSDSAEFYIFVSGCSEVSTPRSPPFRRNDERVAACLRSPSGSWTFVTFRWVRRCTWSTFKHFRFHSFAFGLFCEGCLSSDFFEVRWRLGLWYNCIHVYGIS